MGLNQNNLVRGWSGHHNNSTVNTFYVYKNPVKYPNFSVLDKHSRGLQPNIDEKAKQKMAGMFFWNILEKKECFLTVCCLARTDRPISASAHKVDTD